MPNTTHGPPGVLLPRDIARIWTEEAQKNRPGAPPIKIRTVYAYRKESQIDGGRYRKNPMPLPDGCTGARGNGPWWRASREQDLRDWWNSRPGHGHGTGGRRAGSTRATAS